MKGRPPIQPSSLGMIVWHLRLKAGLSIAQLAAKCGVDEEVLRRLEQGPADDKTVANVTSELAQALGVHILDLTVNDSPRKQAREHWERNHRKRNREML